MGLGPKEIEVILEETTPPGLVQAFENFSQASERLERKYELLQKQVVHLTKQLEQKEQEIKRTEKLATLGETAAAMAHEIRNPLGAMKLFLSMLKDDLHDRPDALELAQQMETSMSTLDHVVSNILQFSKKNEGTFAPINIHSLIREQIEYFEAEYPHVFFEIEFEGSPYVQASEHSVRQVLQNLLRNAMQGMKGEGDVRIGARDAESGELLLEIEDSGEGIPLEIVSRVFEPFVTSKNEGTGLGLAVVRQIIEEQHGGKVSIRNKPNQSGALVTILLPRRASSSSTFKDGSSDGDK